MWSFSCVSAMGRLLACAALGAHAPRRAAVHICTVPPRAGPRRPFTRLAAHRTSRGARDGAPSGAGRHVACVFSRHVSALHALPACERAVRDAHVPVAVAGALCPGHPSWLAAARVLHPAAALAALRACPPCALAHAVLRLGGVGPAHARIRAGGRDRAVAVGGWWRAERGVSGLEVRFLRAGMVYVLLALTGAIARVVLLAGSVPACGCWR